MRAFMPKPYQEGSIYDVLSKFGEALFSRADFPTSDPLLGGTVGWCPVLLTKLVVLQATRGWTDRETVRRASVDLQVKACLGLGIEQNGPSQPTLCRHRQRMQELELDGKYRRRLEELLIALELVAKDEPVLIDSVPVDGAGQQLDTYNLLAAGVRAALRELASVRRRDVVEVANEMGLQVYLDRTVKGRFEVDWSDEASRLALLTRLVDDAVRARDALADARACEDEDEDDDDDGTPPSALDIIDDIIEHDIDHDEDGRVEGIKQRAAGDRLISVTDPDMRNGRKSASKLIAGFKAQVVATVMHGFVLMTRVIKANEHDGEQLPSMVAELRERGHRPPWWGGDHAYGTIRNHQLFASDESNGELVARMARPSNGGRFTKDEFEYDFEDKALTCPAGQRLQKPRWAMRNGRKGRLFVYPADVCDPCAKREACVSEKSKRGRSVFIVDDEEEVIRRHLQRRDEPEFLERLAHRPAVERVIAGFAQCGGKQARRFGMANVAFDASLSALGYNLRRLGSLCAKDDKLAQRAAEKAEAFARAVAHGLVAACWALVAHAPALAAASWALLVLRQPRAERSSAVDLGHPTTVPAYGWFSAATAPAGA